MPWLDLDEHLAAAFDQGEFRARLEAQHAARWLAARRAKHQRYRDARAGDKAWRARRTEQMRAHRAARPAAVERDRMLARERARRRRERLAAAALAVAA
jgi:hypothetical protein